MNYKCQSQIKCQGKDKIIYGLKIFINNINE